MFNFDDEFKHIAKYMDIYELLLEKGSMSQDTIKKALIEAGVPETSARRNAVDFQYPQSGLLWKDGKGRYSLNQSRLEMFLYELADAFRVVIYSKDLVDEIKEDAAMQKENLLKRITELTVENATNLNHCNQHYKDLMRAQTKIANLKHDLENAQTEADALAGVLETMTASPWRMFKGFIKALWNKAVHRERSTEDGEE